MDTLSRYQRGRHGTLEQTWDDVQTQVTSILMFAVQINTNFSYNAVGSTHPKTGVTTTQGKIKEEKDF